MSNMLPLPKLGLGNPLVDLDSLPQGVPKELLPTMLASNYPRILTNKDSNIGPEIHWIISSCARNHWGRMLGNTILSGLANGLQPSVITILWCRPQGQGQLPGLLYNLRHSLGINVVFMSHAMASTQHVGIQTLAQLFLIPEMMHTQHMGVLFTEDDVLILPDARLRINTALSRLPAQEQKQPVGLHVYNPLKEWFQAPNDPAKLDDQNPPDDDITKGGKPFDLSNIRVKKSGYWYGIQGVYFTPGTTSFMLPTALSWRDRVVAGERGGVMNNFQDHMLDLMMKEIGCHNGTAPCSWYSMYPSIVQHMGTNSALFNAETGGLNPRFHMAGDAPTRAAYIGYEKDSLW